MATIIVGHFDRVEHLREAVRLLEGLGFKSSDYAAYYLDPPGHGGGAYLLAEAGTDEDGFSPEITARWIGAPAGPAVGAYLCISTGPSERAEDPCSGRRAPDRRPPSGPMLAIKAAPAAVEAIAVAILGHSVARRISRAQGRWEHGDWIDLDQHEPVMHLLQCDP